MNRVERNYKIKERVNTLIIKSGSIDKVLDNLQKELEEFEASWGEYSSDSLGHGITFNRLAINWIKKNK